MEIKRDHSHLPTGLSVLGVVLLSLAFFSLAREVGQLQRFRDRENLKGLVEENYRVLEKGLQSFLSQVWLEADTGVTASGPGSKYIDQRFQVAANGEVHHFRGEAWVRLPYIPLSSPVQGQDRSLVEAAIEEAKESTQKGQFEVAYTRLLQTQSRLSDPSAVAVLKFEALKQAQGLLDPHLVVGMWEDFHREYKGAVGLNSLPLDPYALMHIAALRKARGDDPEVVRAVRLELVEQLAAGAWKMDKFTQNYLYQRALEELEGEVPADLSTTRRLVVLARYLVEKADLVGWDKGDPAGRKDVRAPQWDAVPVLSKSILVGFRVEERPDFVGLTAITLKLSALEEVLKRSAANLLAGGGGFVLTGTEGKIILAQAGERKDEMVMSERIMTGPGPVASLAVFRPLPEPAWAEVWLPRAGFLLIIIALGGGTLLAIRSLHREVQLARLRRDFVDTVSHELRTPLTSIRLNADLLNRDNFPVERRSGVLASIQGEAIRLERMVADILDISRLRRSGSTWLHPEPVAPGTLVDRSLRSYMPSLQAKGFTLTVDVADELPLVHADLEAAARALGNLIGNAGKYSGSSREIGLTVKKAGDQVAFAIIDHGRGVPEMEVEKIFSRFYRVEDPAVNVPGVGLGLAVAREIARGLDGDIEVSSTPGGGATFTLFLLQSAEQSPGTGDFA